MSEYHCVLTNKFERSFLMICVFTNHICKCRKTCYRMIFQPEHAEDSNINLLNQIFESVSDLFAKDLYLYNCLCISSSSIDKKIGHCCFSVDKIKN